MDAKEYEERKIFLEELKRLVKSEQEAIFRVLKTEKAEYSENSNGIFFDICKLPEPVFQKMKEYIAFCTKNRDDFTQREEEERKAQEILNSDTP
jgi:hypothetical protein